MNLDFFYAKKIDFIDDFRNKLLKSFRSVKNESPCNFFDRPRLLRQSHPDRSEFHLERRGMYASHLKWQLKKDNFKTIISFRTI